MPFYISRHEPELRISAPDNTAASAVRRQVIDISRESVEAFTPAGVDGIVGCKHTPILLPQELVLMSFGHVT